MDKRSYFITGTDTGVGKTYVACALLRAAQATGLSTLGLKPIASGCEFIDQQWRNEDALALQQSATLKFPYEKINPIALPLAIAPHLAAKAKSVNLSVELLMQHHNKLLPLPADFTLIEGAGGWLVPLNATETLADFVAAVKIPVILVVGIRLGCINHALLTAQAIHAYQLPLVGWVANCIDPNNQQQSDIIASLTTRLDAPCLGVIPFNSLSNAHQQLDLSYLLK